MAGRILNQARRTPQVKQSRLLEMVENLPSGAAYVEEDRILFNASVEALIGYSSSEIPTLAAWFSTLYGENAPTVREIYEQHKREGFPTSATVSIRRRDGATRFVEFSAQRYEGAEVWLLHDVTERVTGEEKFRILFEFSSDAHLIFDENGIIDCNNAAITMLQCQDKAQVLSLHPAVLSPEYQPDGRRSLEKCLEMDAIAREQGCHRFEWVHRRMDGTNILVEVTLTPVKLNGKEALLVVWHDVTEIRRLIEAERKERAVAEGQNRVLEMVAQGKPLAQVLEAIVRLIEEQEPGMLCSVLLLEGAALRHGAAPSLPEAYTRAIDGVIIGPQVGSCGTAAYRKEPVIVTDIASDPLWASYVELALAFDLRACWSWPILARDGVVLGTFAVYSHAPHHPSAEELACVRQATHLAGVALERDRREEALRQSEERFALAMEGARDGLWDWNIGTGQVYFSPRYKAMVGYADDEFRDHVDAWRESVHPDDWSHVEEQLHAYFERRLDNYEVEFRMRCKDGSYRWILARGVSLFDAEGRPYRMAGSHTDITEKKQYEHQLKAANRGLAEANERLERQQTELKAANEQLERQKTELERINVYLETLATTDGLTGLKNHRAFQDRLKEEFDRAVRYHTPLSVVLMDVDRFKRYNDAYGHPAGDAVLKQTAAILRQETRSTDVIARYGGEEFVLILPSTGAEEARLLGERIRQAIALASWENEGVTASFGVSTLTLLASTPMALISEADKALYRSKQRGRDCVTHSADVAEDDVEALTLQTFNDLVQSVLAGQGDVLLSASEQMREMLIQSYDATIASWSRILDLRDKETEGHSERVTDRMVQLARYLSMNEEEVMFARWGAWLHDIGKMAVPDRILHKPGPLTEEEWVLMQRHTTVAYEMLRPIKFLGPAIDIPYSHHEKWDGTGYPQGLKGDEIPLPARLFAVIDVYDALCSDRPYRPGWQPSKVKEYIKEQAGIHFDPRAVDVFLKMLDEEQPH